MTPVVKIPPPPPPPRTQWLPYIANAISTQAAKASAAIMLTYLSCDILGPSHYKIKQPHDRLTIIMGIPIHIYILIRDPGLCTSLIKSLWPSDAIWRQRSRSTLAQVMACCLTAPRHYLNQCLLIIDEVQWLSYSDNFTKDGSTFNH